MLCVEALKKVSSPQIEEVKARAWSHFQLNHRKVNLKQKVKCNLCVIRFNAKLDFNPISLKLLSNSNQTLTCKLNLTRNIFLGFDNHVQDVSVPG